jgi:hypothetical protein
MLHCRALKTPKPWKCFLLSGLFLGMAIGIRLTFAPLIVPFLAILFLFPKGEIKQKIPAVVAFAIGGVVANAPSLYFLIIDPLHFWFGNLGYQRLATLYRIETGDKIAMTLGGKLVHIGRVIFSQPGDLLIILVTIFSFLGVRIRQLPRSIAVRPDFLLLGSLMPFLYCGSFAPNLAWPVYFFAPLPFLMLFGPFALAYLQDGEARRACVRLFVLAALVSCFYGNFPKTASAMNILLKPKNWIPVQVHTAATELRTEVSAHGSKDSILTLSPTFAAEAGIPIYPPFVVGVFGWRVSHLMPPSERRHQSLVAPADIDDLFAGALPVVVLGDHVSPTSLQQPIRDFVVKHKYRPKKLSYEVEVWLPPS